MKTSVELLLSKETLTPEDIEKEVDFLQKALNHARKTGEIDIATYLDVGPITTSLRMVMSMITHWKPEARYSAEQAGAFQGGKAQETEAEKLHAQTLFLIPSMFIL